MNDIKLDITFDMKLFKSIYSEARKARNRHIRFGWINGTKYSDKKNKGLYVATVAYWQEFGTTHNGKAHIPARPYFRQFNNIVRSSYTAQIKNYFTAVCRGVDSYYVLESVKTQLVSDYRKVVSTQIHAKLKPSTIRIKGHSYQMDATGLLLSDFDAKIVNKAISNKKVT